MYKKDDVILTEEESRCGLLGVMLEDEDEDETLNDFSVDLKRFVQKIEENVLEKDVEQNILLRDHYIFDYVKKNIEGLCDSYCKETALPVELKVLANKDYCIGVLIRNSLSQLRGVQISTNLNNEIIALEKKIRENRNIEITYDLVNLVQKFIHRRASYPMDLDKKIMGCILSCARLHINIWQIKNYDFQKYMVLMLNTDIKIEDEMKNPSMDYVLDKNDFFDSQRCPNMKPLQDFDKNFVIKRMKKVSINLKHDDYKGILENIFNN